jgi:hypothetical protein
MDDEMRRKIFSFAMAEFTKFQDTRWRPVVENYLKYTSNIQDLHDLIEQGMTLIQKRGGSWSQLGAAILSGLLKGVMIPNRQFVGWLMTKEEALLILLKPLLKSLERNGDYNLLQEVVQGVKMGARVLEAILGLNSLSDFVKGTAQKYIRKGSIPGLALMVLVRKWKSAIAHKLTTLCDLFEEICGSASLSAENGPTILKFFLSLTPRDICEVRDELVSGVVSKFCAKNCQIGIALCKKAAEFAVCREAVIEHMCTSSALSYFPAWCEAMETITREFGHGASQPLFEFLRKVIDDELKFGHRGLPDGRKEFLTKLEPKSPLKQSMKFTVCAENFPNGVSRKNPSFYGSIVQTAEYVPAFCGWKELAVLVSLLPPDLESLECLKRVVQVHNHPLVGAFVGLLRKCSDSLILGFLDYLFVGQSCKLRMTAIEIVQGLVGYEITDFLFSPIAEHLCKVIMNSREVQPVRCKAIRTVLMLGQNTSSLRHAILKPTLDFVNMLTDVAEVDARAMDKPIMSELKRDSSYTHIVTTESMDIHSQPQRKLSFNHSEIKLPSHSASPLLRRLRPFPNPCAAKMVVQNSLRGHRCAIPQILPTLYE